MSSKDENEKFQPITDKKEILSFIRLSARTFAQALVWTSGQNALFETRLSSFNSEAGLFLVESPDKEVFENFWTSLSRKKFTDCFVNIRLPHGSIFFATQFAGVEAGFLQLHFPEIVYRVQRRRSYRLKLMTFPEIPVTAEILSLTRPEKKIGEKKLFDLSIEGTSILFKEDFPDIPEFGDEVVLRMKLKNLGVNLKGKVLRARKFLLNRKVQTVRVGVKFVDISATEEQRLASFIFEESCRRLLGNSGGVRDGE